MSTIYMVASNTIDPGNEVIFGFYPTLALATARKKSVMSDTDITGSLEEDFVAFIVPVDVASTGADTYLSLR